MAPPEDGGAIPKSQYQPCAPVDSMHNPSKSEEIDIPPLELPRLQNQTESPQTERVLPQRPKTSPLTGSESNTGCPLPKSSYTSSMPTVGALALSGQAEEIISHHFKAAEVEGKWIQGTYAAYVRVFTGTTNHLRQQNFQDFPLFIPAGHDFEIITGKGIKVTAAQSG